MKYLFIDDERFPPSNADYDDWFIARESNVAIEFVKTFGCPSFISFDHDLGGSDTAMKFIVWLIDQDIEHDIIPDNFEYYIHSQNCVGRDNIKGLIDNYLKFKSEKNY
tara:strand:+ start:508 stop:831 length:324 start_codon:yes stop_codon:yes gene_type:complete